MLYLAIAPHRKQVPYLWSVPPTRSPAIRMKGLRMRSLRNCVFLLPWLLSCPGLTGAADGERPNVLIFLIDDLGCTDLGVDGSTFYETPRLDALARSAVRFTSFYAACAVCSPTRAALMTGKIPQRVGITDWIHPGSGVAIPAAEVTLGEAFQQGGYQTAYLGKWHLGEQDQDHPTRHGWEWTRGVNRAGQPASYHYPYRRGEKPTVWDVPDFDGGKAGDYLTDVLTTAAIDFLRQRDVGRPFLICFGHYAVHTPIQPPAGLAAKYADKRRQRWGEAAAAPLPAPFGAASRARQDDAAYAAMVENLDTNVGRLLDALEQLDLTRRTIVVFTSDNGGLCTLSGGRTGPTCNLPQRSGKGWNYEGGIRVPGLIAWPGQLAPAAVDVPAFTADLYPTLLELCGLPPLADQHRDGRSLAAVARGQPDDRLRSRTLGWYYPHDHGSGHKASAALRRANFKLIHYLAGGQSELYDLSADPGEASDLSAAHPAQAAELREELLRWIESTRSK
jgi:arylsulfatase A